LTELYFDPFDIEWRDPTRVIGNPGISMVFYRGDPSHLKEKAIQLTAMQPHLTMLRYSEMFFAFLPPFPHDMSETDIRAFLDSALQNDTFGAYMGDRPAYAELNTALINQIFETPVVIENSPPEIIPFHQLISKPSILAVGTFLGLQLSGLNEMLLLTAPAGIIVVGSAVSIARAIDKGLNHYVDRIFATEPKTPRRRRRRSEHSP
jgi:hypothetical protein